MKQHCVAGEQILNRVSFLRPAAGIIRHHHERFDGRGYPDGLAEEDIPLGARIFAFADTMDAMTSDRPYRSAPGWEATYEEIARCVGGQFDPHIADAYLSISMEEWKTIRETIEAERLKDSNLAPVTSAP